MMVTITCTSATLDGMLGQTTFGVKTRLFDADKGPIEAATSSMMSPAIHFSMKTTSP
jgi:hypothetical protein